MNLQLSKYMAILVMKFEVCGYKISENTCFQLALSYLLKCQNVTGIFLQEISFVILFEKVHLVIIGPNFVASPSFY